MAILITKRMQSLTKLLALYPSRPNKVRTLVFWVVAPCCQEECYQRFTLTLMAKAMSSSEPSKIILDCVVSHRKDGNSESHCRENIRSAAQRSYAEIRTYEIRYRKPDTNMILRFKRHGND